MPFKLDVERLSKDELVYELQIRGITESDKVDSLRKTLRSALSIEKDSSFVLNLPSEDSTEEELVICENKLKDLQGLLPGFSGSTTQVRKIESKISHCYNRFERFSTKDPALLTRRSVLLKSLMDLISEYNTKVKTIKDAQVAQQQNNPLDPSFSGGASGDVRPPLTSSPGHQALPNANTFDQGLPNVFNQTLQSTSVSSVPVYKWQVKFAGKPTESFNAFLEEVEEHCQSRNVDRTHLFAAARDLFTGDALRLYNYLKKYASDWDNLVSLMKEEYVPSADKLWQQILERTQGESESIGLYVAIMTSLFDRMPTPVMDSLRLQVLQKNILPFYQERLALTEIRTQLELIEVCRKLEVTRASVSNFKPPRLSSLSLEPDLAYADTSRRSRPSLNEIEVREPVCYRCKERGHMVKDCHRPRHDFKCFRCGRLGFVKTNCPTCNPNLQWGNNSNLQQGNSNLQQGNSNLRQGNNLQRGNNISQRGNNNYKGNVNRGNHNVSGNGQRR